jgi:hypothetical protein
VLYLFDPAAVVTGVALALPVRAQVDFVLFGQDGISEKDLNEAKHGRITNYEAFADALARLHTAMNNRGLKSVAMPYLIGCGLAKGNWNVVAAMIDAEFDNSDIDVVLYKFC